MSLARRESSRSFPDLFDWPDNLTSFFTWPPALAPRGIKIEEFVQDGRFVVRAELPGIDPDKDVAVHVSDGIVSIEAERQENKHENGRSEFHYGKFVRRIALPAGVEDDKVQALYRGGILEVSMPMDGDQPEPRKVPITTEDPKE
ncbi:MAG TPA: Hsp20/alpha crystallin family protein [Mycobacteriales bacterium]|nr:Hsp20/alpha crystallin family protein [Mycobacteriales bacterium]